MRGFRQGRSVDPDRAQQAVGDRAVRARALDRVGTAVQQAQLAVDLEFIALGVTAEIIVVVEQQDPRLGVRGPVEVGGRQAADPGPDDDQGVFLADVDRLRQALAVAQLVEDLEGADVAATQPGQGGRVVPGKVLRRHRRGDHAVAGCQRACKQTRACERRPLHEITPRDRAVHSQVPIGRRALALACH